MLYKAVWAEQGFSTGGRGQVSDQTNYRRPMSSSGGDAWAAEPVPVGAWLPWRAGRGCIYEWIWRNSSMSPRCNCITPLLLHTHSTHWGTKSWMKRSSCQLRQRQLRKLSHSSFLLEDILSVVSLHTKCGLQQIRQDKIQRVLLLGSKTTGPKHYKGGDKWCMCCRDNVQMLSVQDRFPWFYTAAQQKLNPWAWWFWMSFLCRNLQGSLWRDFSDLGGKKKPALTYVAHLSGDILNAVYYGSSLQNSLTPHFQGLTASCFDKTWRKAWFLFSFYLRPLNMLWIFKTTQYTPVTIWEQTFRRDLCPCTYPYVGSAWKPFPCCWCWRGQLLLSSRCNLESWDLGRRCSLCAHITLIITQSEPGQPFWRLWCYRVHYTTATNQLNLGSNLASFCQWRKPERIFNMR